MAGEEVGNPLQLYRRKLKVGDTSMYEVDRAYPIPIGPIFNMYGDFVGLGYASSRNSNDVLVKSPFNDNYLISDVTHLMDRGYQFSTNVCTLPGCPGMGTGEEFGWNNF